MKKLLLLALSLATACAPKDEKTGYKFQGVPVTPVVDAPPLKLERGNGTIFDLQAEKGKPALIFFGYTNCPDFCPTTLADWKRVKKALGGKADSVNFLFVTIDPKRDTPAVTDAYAKQFDPSFVGLSGDSATIAAVSKSYGTTAVVSHTNEHSGHYEMGHPSHQYVVDGAGKLRFAYPFGFKAEDIAEDIKHL